MVASQNLGYKCNNNNNYNYTIIVIAIVIYWVTLKVKRFPAEVFVVGLYGNIISIIIIILYPKYNKYQIHKIGWSKKCIPISSSAEWKVNGTRALYKNEILSVL